MARVTEEAFEDGTEIVRVYLAATLAEAQSAERALDGAGLDYVAEPEEFGARAALGSSIQTGVGIWVAEAEVDPAVDALARAGVTAGLVKR
jgi:hypothetical protein